MVRHSSYHKWNDQWHIAFESYNLHQNNVPNALNPLVSGPGGIVQSGGAPFSPQFIAFNAPNLAQCSNAVVLSCTASVQTYVYYLNYKPTALDNISWRGEFYDDKEGQRTGTRARYVETGLGWQHWFSPQIEMRPEFTYYKALDAFAFNGNSNLGNRRDRAGRQFARGLDTGPAVRDELRDSTAFGALMNTRGLTEIVVLTIGLDLKVISPRMFTMMVMMALVTTAMAGPLLRILFRGRPQPGQPAGIGEGADSVYQAGPGRIHEGPSAEYPAGAPACGKPPRGASRGRARFAGGDMTAIPPYLWFASQSGGAVYVSVRTSLLQGEKPYDEGHGPS